MENYLRAEWESEIKAADRASRVNAVPTIQ